MSQVEVAVADVTTAPGEVQPGTRILPDYGAGYCSNGTTYPGGSKAQKAACEAAGGSWTYSLLTANANTFERTYAMKNGATNYVAHDFTYGIKASNSTALITSVSGATQSGDSVSGTYYEPVWQGWTGCADGNNIYTTACADGSAPRFYYRGSFMSGLFTLPRYDGMIYGFAGAEQSNENWQMSVNSTIDFHDTEIGSNSQVQPLAINVKKGANYTPASDVLGPSTKVSTKAGIEDVSTSEVDKSITVKITPDASYTTLTSRYSTAFYTQDWMYWGSEARDASNASAIKWTSGSGVLYDELTAPNGSYTGTDRFDPSSSYQAMNYIPTWITARYRADSIYYSPQHTANQNGVPNSMEGVDGRYQGGADPLTNPNNPTFSAAQLQMTSFTGTNYDRATGFAIAALYGTASDNDGMIWLGGLGSAGSPINTATNQDGTQTLNQSCANTYYVADDVKLRFAYPAGKEQEPVEHYYYPIAVNSSTGEPIYSNGRNDGSGVYDLNCGMGLYAKNDYSQPHSLDQFSLDVDPLGADNFSGFFRGAASFTGLSGRRWNQPFVRTRNAATPEVGAGWTYDRAAASTDSVDRAKESDLHPGDQLPSSEIALRDNGSDAGTFPTDATANNSALGTLITASTCTNVNNAACALLSPDTAKAVLVDSLGRAPADPYDDPSYWYTSTRSTTIAANPDDTTITKYTGSYTQADGGTGSMAVNNPGLAGAAVGTCTNTTYTTQYDCQRWGYQWYTAYSSGVTQNGSPLTTFDQLQYSKTATNPALMTDHEGTRVDISSTSYSTSYARTSPLLRSVGQQLRQTCWQNGTAATNGTYDTFHNCTLVGGNNTLGQADNREWVLDTSANGNHLQDGFHVANLGAAMKNDADGDGSLDATYDDDDNSATPEVETAAVRVYPTYTVPSDQVPERDGYAFLGYRVKAYGTSYTKVSEAQCWDYDNVNSTTRLLNIIDYLDTLFDAWDEIGNYANGWDSTKTNLCTTATGAENSLGYRYLTNPIATAQSATYAYQPVNTDVAANPTLGLTTIYVNGHPYIDGAESANYSSGDFEDVDGRYVDTGGVFKIVDTHDYVLLQPGDEIIPVGHNLKGGTGADKDAYYDFYANDTFGFTDAYQYAGACSEPTITIESVCTYRGYTWTPYSGMEAPLWTIELEPVWGRPVYYTDHTSPDFYDTSGQVAGYLAPDLIENCGSPLASPAHDCRMVDATQMGLENENGWNIDDYIIEDRTYKVRFAENAAADQNLPTGNPTLKNFQFGKYELFLGLKATGTNKDATIAQLQPTGVALGLDATAAEAAGVDETNYNTATGIHLGDPPGYLGDYAPGDTVPDLFDFDGDHGNLPANAAQTTWTKASKWEELKLLTTWHYRVRYLDRTGTSYDGVNSVTYTGTNTDELTGADPEADWDDRNYFYWDGNAWKAACNVPSGNPATIGNCAAPGDPTASDQRGYSSPDYKIPATAPTLTNAQFQYYQVWINGERLTTGGSGRLSHTGSGTYTEANTGKFQPGDTISIETIMAYGGDIELRAVWETYQVVHHGVTNTGSGFTGKITKSEMPLLEGDSFHKPTDTVSGTVDERAGDHSADGSHDPDNSFVEDGDGHDYVFTGRWLDGANNVVTYTTAGVSTVPLNRANTWGSCNVDETYCLRIYDLWAEWDPSIFRVVFHPDQGAIANAAGTTGRNCPSADWHADATCATTTEPGDTVTLPASENGAIYWVPSYLTKDVCSVNPDTNTTQALCEADGGQWGVPTKTCTVDPDTNTTQALCLAARPTWEQGVCSVDPDDNSTQARCERPVETWTPGTCSDGESTTQAICEAKSVNTWNEEHVAEDATCSDPAYTDSASCLAVKHTWTAGSCSDGASTNQDSCEATKVGQWQDSASDYVCRRPDGTIDTSSTDRSACLASVRWISTAENAQLWSAQYLSLWDAFGEDQGWPADPTRTGYVFTGWYLAKAQCSVSPELYDTEAKCDANGGTWPKLNNGPGFLTPTVNPAKTSYDSDNGYLWFEDDAYAGASTDADGEHTLTKYDVMRNYDFWAGWVKKKFDLYYDLNATDTTAAYGTGADWDTDGDNFKLDGSTPTRAGYDEDLEYQDLISGARNIDWSTDSTLKPTRDHYEFTGWSLGSCTADGYPAQAIGTTRMPDLDDGNPANDPDYFTVYACWKIHANDIHYHLNADSDPTAAYGTGTDYTTVGDDQKPNGDPTGTGWDEDYPYGELVSDAPNYTDDPTSTLAPTREGYDFTGWYLDENCEVATPVGDTTMPDQDLDLYACWTKQVHDVYYHPNAGAGEVSFPAGCSGLVSGVTAPTSDSETIPQDAAYTYGDPIADAPNYTSCVPVRAGYTFIGWTIDAAGLIPIGTVTMPDHDYEVYAQWEQLPASPTPIESSDKPQDPNSPTPTESTTPTPTPSESLTPTPTPTPSNTDKAKNPTPTPTPTEDPGDDDDGDDDDDLAFTGGPDPAGPLWVALSLFSVGLAFVRTRRRR